MKTLFNMPFRGTIVLLSLLVAAVVSSCHKDDDVPVRDTRTVIVYMAAENSLVDYAGMDIQEMLSATNQLGNGDHLVIYLDDLSVPRIYVLDNRNTALSLSNLSPVYTFDSDVNSADVSTLDFVIDYAVRHYPATSYGCVFWSHGSGWLFDDTSSAYSRQRGPALYSFGVDNGNNDRSNRGHKMYIPDMAEVMSAYPRMKFIMFDACFMQAVEVAYELKDCAEYIIGSPAEIPAYGAPYHLTMSKMFAENFSPGAFIASYADYYSSYYSFGVVLSAIKTDEADDFILYMDGVMRTHDWLTADYSKCLDYYLYEWNSMLNVSNPMPDYFDMKGLMMCMLSEQEMAEWQSVYDRMVVSCSIPRCWWSAYARYGRGDIVDVDPSQCGGVSMFLPLEIYKRHSFYYDYYNTRWSRLFNIE